MFGVWGMVLLLINYFRIFNFGIANSVSVSLVQYKSDSDYERKIISSGLAVILILWAGLSLIAVAYGFFGNLLFKEYSLDQKFYFILGIAALAYCNTLFSYIYRVKNSLYQVAFFQTIIPVLVLISVVLFREEQLLDILLYCYLIGQILSTVVFLIGGRIFPLCSFEGNMMLRVLKKGFFLFVYNLCFYLIIISLKTLISMFFTVEEFGLFSFTYAISNSVLLLLEAIAFAVFPKVLDRFGVADYEGANKVTNLINNSYVTVSHMFSYLLILFYSNLIFLMPEYSDTALVFSLTTLSLILYTNSFPFNSLLMAKNKEKTIAFISLIGLLVNVIIILILVVGFDVGYQYVVFATMISYIIYMILSSFFSSLLFDKNYSFKKVMLESFPTRLFLPFFIAVFICLFNVKLIFISLILFVILNRLQLKDNVKLVVKIIKNPEFINI